MTLSLEFNSLQIERLASRFAQANGMIQDVMYRGMATSLDIVEQGVVNHMPVNSGELRRSPQKLVRGVGLNVEGQYATNSPYGWPVERGRRPGQPPPTEAIKLWVIRRGIATGKAADSIAYLIARAIGRRGTKGAFMFEKGAEAAAPAVSQVWVKTAERITGQLGVSE